MFAQFFVRWIQKFSEGAHMSFFPICCIRFAVQHAAFAYHHVKLTLWTFHILDLEAQVMTYQSKLEEEGKMREDYRVPPEVV